MTTSETTDTQSRNWGGRRAGAGRPPKLDCVNNLSRQADLRIADYLLDLVKTLLDLAVGEYKEETDPATGQTRRVYTREPNSEVCLYLADRILSKEKETL